MRSRNIALPSGEASALCLTRKRTLRTLQLPISISVRNVPVARWISPLLSSLFPESCPQRQTLCTATILLLYLMNNLGASALFPTHNCCRAAVQ